MPDKLYHRYVEFKPFVAGMFTDHSLRGRILNHALHHQHARIYSYNRSTVYGLFPRPTTDMTRKFLELVHHDQGGRIFTYVLTLDAQWRFTETGKEFGIDLLSKHTMHSDVAIYIAFSGEFFIRRLKHPRKEANNPSPDPGTEALPPAPEPDETHEVEEPPKDPMYYELIIDNDSGTYRPNAKYLHTLKQFMQKNLPGLKISTLDCGADEEKMGKLKGEQREKKKTSGKQITYQQNASNSSISSSDQEELDDRAGVGAERGKIHKMTDKAKQPKQAAMGIISGGELGGASSQPIEQAPHHESERAKMRGQGAGTEAKVEDMPAAQPGEGTVDAHTAAQ